MERYSAIKRNEVLIHATVWMNLENIMLSESSQTQKATYCMIPFIRHVQNRQIHRDRRYIGDCQGQREGNGGCLLKRMGVSFWCDEHVLRLFVEMVGLCEYTKDH